MKIVIESCKKNIIKADGKKLKTGVTLMRPSILTTLFRSDM